ncbi:MAG: transketolase family protein [Candidatus Berkelbacteria bacterium]|nr:MAG: transketolase family protein [Candidatus Berkelbacteria bacterium]QQG52150.1 MAG: transketolase family protein [Candidatus Berkelbacteria bacterium]
MQLLNGVGVGELEQAAIRDGFGEALLQLGKHNESIVALTADLTESTRVQQFAKSFPERFFEIGVAEQNLIGIAAGLSHEGFIPFAASYAVFSPGRTWDQIRVSVCYSKNNVKIIGSHAGLSVGADGATHQALEDVAIMRVLPNMVVVVPCDATEAHKATLAIAKHKGPCYLRLGREKVPTITSEETPFELGKAITITKGSDVTIVANGPLVFNALQAAHQLEGTYSVRVVNLHTVKPLDHKTILDAAEETGAIVTAEDHQIDGGMGSAVAELVSQFNPVPVVRVGVKDSFGESGSVKELMDHFGLNVEAICDAVKKAITLKGKNAR